MGEAVSIVMTWSGLFVREDKILKPSLMAVSNLILPNLTTSIIFLNFLCILLTISTVPSGLESSITRIRRLRPNLFTARIKSSMFSDSLQIGIKTVELRSGSLRDY